MKEEDVTNVDNLEESNLNDSTDESESNTDEKDESQTEETTENSEDNSEDNLERPSSDSDESQDVDTEEIIVSIGEDELPKQDKTAPPWVKDLRKKNKEQVKRIKELESQVQAVKGVDNPNLTLGEKPSLESCDHDEEVYEKKLTSWHDRKTEINKNQEIENQKRETETKSWQKRIDFYNESKDELKVSDYDDAEFIAQQELSNTQQGIIVQGAENPALVMYALGKNPKKLNELSKNNNPVNFAFEIAKLESKLNITKRKPSTKPEKVLKSSATTSNSDSQLDRLREEASTTGDYSKVTQYTRKLRSKNNG